MLTAGTTAKRTFDRGKKCLRIRSQLSEVRLRGHPRRPASLLPLGTRRVDLRLSKSSNDRLVLRNTFCPSLVDE